MILETIAGRVPLEQSELIELMWGASTVWSYVESDDFIRQTTKYFSSEVVTAVNNHNKL